MQHPRSSGTTPEVPLSDRGSLDRPEEVAQEFLKQTPADFPCIFDGDASVAAVIGGGQSWPTTFFLDRKGEVAQVHIGAYATEEQLTQDIQRYALGRG